jgi:uncharacterized protein (TIGR03032 family)
VTNGTDAAAAIRACLTGGDDASSVAALRTSRSPIPPPPTPRFIPTGPPLLPLETNDGLIRAAATEEFAAILDREGISLAVSTGRQGRVVLIRAISPTRLSMTVRPFRSPFGLAWSEDRLVIGTEREIWEFTNDAVAASKMGNRDACLMPRSMWFTGAVAIHEMVFAGDELWFANTLFSTLCTLDGRHSFVPRWHPRFITTPSPDDACHLNGIAVSDGRVVLASAFGDSPSSAGWRERRRDSGVLIDFSSGEPVVHGLCVPHSPRIHHGTTFVLESQKGTMAVADLTRGSAETVAELPGFTRGLAFARRYAFIGLSKVRPSASFAIPLLDRVAETECGIHIIDLQTGRDVATLRFDTGATELFDLQVLPLRAPELLDTRSAVAGMTFMLP